MEPLRKLKYLGKKPLPLTITAPWLSDAVVIDKSGECVCSDGDAKALMDLNPRMFSDLGPIEPPEKIGVEAVPDKKPARRKPAKKKKE